MPLHDWSVRSNWEGLRIYWMTEIARDLKNRLPEGFRAVIGSSPLVAIGFSTVKPDVAVTQSHDLQKNTPDGEFCEEPDFEVAVTTLEEDSSVLIEREGRLIAAIELVSPRNKDRPAARSQYATRYANYLRNGVHLMLIDVHRRLIAYSFAGEIATALGQPIESPIPASAVCYRVGGPAANGGRMLSVWQKTLKIGEPLPAMPLPLGPEILVNVHLEETYNRAAADNYVGNE